MPRLSASFRNLFRRDRVERDLDDELRAYVELAADENRHAGLPEPAAHRAALVDLGGIEQVKEHVRAARAGAFVEQLSQDLSYAFRVLRKYRGFTVVAVITLGARHRRGDRRFQHRRHHHRPAAAVRRSRTAR